ncbi:hypothetical protein H4582DRAFT_2057058 [Lactarius indigo]|nr:hypothetical protein H4582DRAFT_2057058 [Lactarius indigo]
MSLSSSRPHRDLLDGRHAVSVKVINGMLTLRKIENVSTGSSNWPKLAIEIIGMTMASGLNVERCKELVGSRCTISRIITIPYGRCPELWRRNNQASQFHIYLNRDDGPGSQISGSPVGPNKATKSDRSCKDKFTVRGACGWAPISKTVLWSNSPVVFSGERGQENLRRLRSPKDYCRGDTVVNDDRKVEDTSWVE